MKRSGYVLTINVGNANVVFGVWAGEKYLGKWRCETRPGRAADEYGQWLISILENVDIDPKFISGAILASVVPTVDKVIVSMCRRFFEVEPLVVMPGIKTGVQINYGRAGDLGPDRLANIVALSDAYESPAVVVDFGTTTSFDVLGCDGVYAGGAIAPGVSLALEALSSAAPHLPNVALTKPDHVIGRNIVHSMQAGCFWGTVDMVEGIIHRMWEELGVQKGTCVATGGFAREMIDGIRVFEKVDTNLTLRGLKLIYERNV